MKLKYKILLLIDCIVNLMIGIVLLLFPIGIIDFFGFPQTNTNFYPSILGAILLGVGSSLFLELAGHAKHLRGIGLGGAILINIVGSIVLIFLPYIRFLDRPSERSDNLMGDRFNCFFN